MSAQRILVPLDGSATSEGALPVAEAVARRTQGTLALIRAVESSSMTAIAETEEYLATTSQRIAKRGLTVETGVPVGSPAEWILEEIDLRKVTLVVMGTHDRSGPDRWLHGSVAESVIGRAAVPVMVVHTTGGAAPAERFDQPMPILVVPLDGSEFAEAALPTAIQLANDWNARLVLVSVIAPAARVAYTDGMLAPYDDVDATALRQQAEGYLRKITIQVGPELVQATLVALGEPAAQISVAAEEFGAAAVVMATHGRTGVVRTLLGSVAGQVVHSSALPVVLVRSAMLRGAEAPVGSAPPVAAFA